MLFHLIPRSETVPQQGVSVVYLWIDHWNDYSFVTMFDVVLYDEFGVRHHLENVKIGFKGQLTSQPTFQALPASFPALPEGFFSVGCDVDYYRILGQAVSQKTRDEFLRGVRDIVVDVNAMQNATGEPVFKTSLLRYVSMATVNGQYTRVLAGMSPLTDYKFSYLRPVTDRYSGLELKFVVKADSKPSTNIHALIGRNGVGKTTILNDMIDAVMRSEGAFGTFYDDSDWERTPIAGTYFASLVSVSFSAFDPFDPPQERSDPELGPRYSYIGLKVEGDTSGALKTLDTLRRECLASLTECFVDVSKKDRWRDAIRTLGSDENFAQMELWQLAAMQETDWRRYAAWYIHNMSAGHAIVLLTVSKLVARVEEKTLVLLDEPESHLHPPLLSAFTRALSELLHHRNGLAIVATHSPVVLQEVPKSCVSVITRLRLSASIKQPSIETFGENVGVLTREVFGLEVTSSGFHSLLEADARKGAGYEEIVSDYQGQLGQEAKGMLRAMITDPRSVNPET
ncbi:AAA family ATPase [Neorhizobium sp. T6_25]|uniref:AAA family ATPase n=1 Tax=Neorhizobium sp. T6_25 TaxID=2093833 RepID=UPI000CF87B8F|nr:AAA family ATPase [Neorhizobium sp. T6_25]